MDQEDDMAQHAGKVYLVGAGPGAPDLITLRGKACLERAQVVVYDDLSPAELLSHCPDDVERIYVGKREDRKTLEQEEISDLLVRKSRDGKRVVRLKGGDPYVFGRGGEEAGALAARGIPFEVVPGVTAMAAAPAYAGIPLTHREHADGFEVISGHRPDETPRMTAVVPMAMRRLEQNVDRLRQRGYRGDLPAAVVRWGTTSRQQTITATLDTIAEAAAGLGSPALLVVGDVVSERPALAWFERRPLFGTRVLVTRARHQAAETCRLLEASGAETISMPTIHVAPPADEAPLLRAAQDPGRYDFLLLTSANGVEALRGAMQRAGVDARALAGVQICAIGPGTARAMSALGLTPDQVPDDHRAEGLLELLDEARVRGKRILLPRAAVAREILPDTLRARGATVDLVEAYRTTLPPAQASARGVQALEDGDVDVLTFTSASTVLNFAEILGHRLEGLTRDLLVAAIGPITADACAEVGLPVHVMPEKYTLAALVAALIDHLGPGGDPPASRPASQ